MINNKIEQYKNLNLPIRLHLGCGPVLIDGYINIDGYSNNPDVVQQNIIGPFPIPDNSVDEILSIHVIEHISRKFIDNMIKEWHRILKPGGCVIVEWPDMLKAAKKIADNPTILLSDNRKDLKQTYFVFFFDDTRYEDGPMIHRWGYSEESLGHLFVKNGFRRWTSQTNQYKKSNVDSRIVCYK